MKKDAIVFLLCNLHKLGHFDAIHLCRMYFSHNKFYTLSCKCLLQYRSSKLKINSDALDLTLTSSEHLTLLDLSDRILITSQKPLQHAILYNSSLNTIIPYTRTFQFLCIKMTTCLVHKVLFVFIKALFYN